VAKLYFCFLVAVTLPVANMWWTEQHATLLYPKFKNLLWIALDQVPSAATCWWGCHPFGYYAVYVGSYSWQRTTNICCL